MTSSSAVQSVLCGIPGAALTESEASSLQLCGSIKDISQCSLQNILDYTDLAPDRSVHDAKSTLLALHDQLQ